MNWLRKLSAWIAGQVQGHIPFFRVGTSTDTGDAAIAEATGSVDSSGNGILHVGNLFAWAYEMVFGTLKITLFRRESVTIQTHNAVSVGANAFAASSAVIDCRNFDSICCAVRSDASHTRSMNIDWYADSAATTVIGSEVVIVSTSAQTGIARTTVKAPYCKVAPFNGDTGASHTMSTWTHLIP